MNKLIFTLLLLGVSASAGAATIASYTNPAGSGDYYGVSYAESVMTPGGGPWENIGFHFIDYNGDSHASGGLYVLSQAYTGRPSNLNSSVAGYLDFTNTVVDNVWTFDNLTLNPNTQYFFLMDSNPTMALKLALTNPYAGGVLYASGGAGSFQAIPSADMLFVLSGDEVATAPEPGTWALMTGAAGMVAWFRRRNARFPGQE